MNFDKIFNIINWFVWGISFIVFVVAVIGYYYSGDENFYRPIMEYAGLTWLLLWPAICWMVTMIIKANKGN